MGLLDDRFVADWFGTRIEVEGSVFGLVGATFRLVIADQKADEGVIAPGATLRLRGRIADKKVVAELVRGWFGTRCRLLVDDREHPIRRVG
jgi:hypothetical protein